MLRHTLAVIVALLGLSACGELPRPFQPESKADDNPLLVLVDRAGLVVRPVDGLPSPAAAAFAEALAAALREQGVAAMTGGGNVASLRLGGAARAAPDGWDVTLALADARSATLGSVSAHVAPAAVADTKSWGGYAAPLARSIVAMLPADGTEIGPQPSVAIGEVTGMPGNGNLTLARALAFTLRRAQVQIAAAPDQATHIVAAAVTVAPPRGPAGHEVSNVDVRWRVMRADKSEVGEVRQANDVPVTLLDRDWPDIALAVADSATDSIAGLLKRPAR